MSGRLDLVLWWVDHPPNILSFDERESGDVVWWGRRPRNLMSGPPYILSFDEPIGCRIPYSVLACLSTEMKAVRSPGLDINSYRPNFQCCQSKPSFETSHCTQYEWPYRTMNSTNKVIGNTAYWERLFYKVQQCCVSRPKLLHYRIKLG